MAEAPLGTAAGTSRSVAGNGRARQRVQAKVLHAAEPKAVPKVLGDVSKAGSRPAVTLNQAPTTTTAATSHPQPLSTALQKQQEYDWEDSEEEQPAAPLLKPVFVKKEVRQQAVATDARDKAVEAARKAREQEAHELLVQLVRREYEAAAVTREETDAGCFDPSTVDDADDSDCALELEAWKLRELLRIKRDRAERERWEREKMELERIRNMTEEERRQLDEAKMKEWMEQPRSQMRFMQKYYHKGAFFMDDGEALYQRDYAQPTGEDASANREILPEVKQVRDFGKKGRTKWTHLVGEDTTEFGYGWGQRKNELNYKMVGKMGGMRGQLDNPSKRPKQ